MADEILFRVNGDKMDKEERLSNAHGQFADEEEARLFYGFLVEHGYRSVFERVTRKVLKKHEPPLEGYDRELL